MKNIMGSRTLTATQYPSHEAHVGASALRLVIIKEMVDLCLLLPHYIVGARLHTSSDLDKRPSLFSCRCCMVSVGFFFPEQITITYVV